MEDSGAVCKKFQQKRVQLATDHKINYKTFNLIKGAQTISFDAILEATSYDEIGNGEKGTCYRCQFNSDHPFANRTILVKCPLANNTNEDLFLHEAATIANIWCIGHPNFVRPVILPENSHILIVHNGRQLYPVMELVEGTTLSDIFSSATLLETWTVFDRIWLFVQLAESLKFMHANGNPHWDLHFGNIIVQDNGHQEKTPVIIDLGSMANTDIPPGQRADDLSKLWMVFKVLLGSIELLPQPYSDWGKNIDSETLPKSITDVCVAFGPMGSGPLCCIKTDGTEVHVHAHVGKGIHYINFEEMHHRNEDYCKDIFQRVRKEQKEAINKAISRVPVPVPVPVPVSPALLVPVTPTAAPVIPTFDSLLSVDLTKLTLN